MVHLLEIGEYVTVMGVQIYTHNSAIEYFTKRTNCKKTYQNWKRCLHWAKFIIQNGVNIGDH